LNAWYAPSEMPAAMNPRSVSPQSWRIAGTTCSTSQRSKRSWTQLLCQGAAVWSNHVAHGGQETA
jgi:hypothetical protein